ncbi:MAG: type II toxin-antitoxin system VapB family antitoxin [Pseudomonadota bacterium]|nr:type II toxin-antitoxin system VapB family antitoxin [Pseudomonadota bacterium]
MPNIVIGDALVEEAFTVSNVNTKREPVDRALREFVARHKRKNLMDLYGSEGMDPDCDYKRSRSGES